MELGFSIVKSNCWVSWEIRDSIIKLQFRFFITKNIYYLKYVSYWGSYVFKILNTFLGMTLIQQHSIWKHNLTNKVELKNCMYSLELPAV